MLPFFLVDPSPFLLVFLRAVKHILEALKPYLVENGGVIKADHVTFVEGRGNLMLEYCPEGASGGCGLIHHMFQPGPTCTHDTYCIYCVQ